MAISRKAAIERLSLLRPRDPSIPAVAVHFRTEPIGRDIVVDRENWVRMWVDRGHCVRSACGLIEAQRGITIEGQPLWLVRHRDKAHGYHSAHSDPREAITEAEAAWAERRRVRQRWDEVEKIARELLRGRRRLRITIEDAYESALCEVGTRAFMRRVGLGRVRTLPGVAVALLMKIEPQVGFVIFRAHEREAGLPAMAAAQGRQPCDRRPRQRGHAGIDSAFSAGGGTG
jgi:hypothetical protein